MRLLIIGGSDAGISAALRAHELESSAEVTVALADDFPNFSVCGLPFYLSGETPDWRNLAHRTEFQGIELLRGHRATAIDPHAKTVTIKRASLPGEISLSYDKLIVATGAEPRSAFGLRKADVPGVFPLHTMGDAFAVQSALEGRHSVVIVGAGYIGLEMADALIHRGLSVTIISRRDPIFPTMDSEFGNRLTRELQSHGVNVLAGYSAVGIEPATAGSRVLCSDGTEALGDVVLVAAGVRPASALAASAGVPLGASRAIQVDRRMRTAVPDLFAAGDCVETWHRVLERPVYLPLGTTAHKQGRVAGENAISGGPGREFAGSVGTQVVKVFDTVLARTGLLEHEARAAGFDTAVAEAEAWDHKAYYPGARMLTLRILGDRRSGRLLGAQIMGPWTAEISKRIDVFASALFHRSTVESLNDLDLSYTPPLGSPWDAIQIAAQHWSGSVGRAQ